MALTVVQEYRAIGRHGSNGWRATLGPLSIVASTKTEARERLMSQVEQAISGPWEPVLMAYGPHHAMVYRMPYGWCYQLGAIGGPKYQAAVGRVESVRSDGAAIVTMGGQSSRDDTIRSARNHLAQAAWPDLNGLDLLAGDHEAILDHLHWIGFQRAYAWAVSATGFTESGMHQYACEKANEDRWLQADELAARDAARNG